MLSRKQLLILSILAIGWLLQQQQAQAQVVIYATDPIADRMAVQLDAYRFSYMVASDRWRWRLEVAERHRSKLERMRADLRMAGQDRITAARQARDSREARDWQVGGYGQVTGSFYARQNDRVTLKRETGELVFVSYSHLAARDREYIQGITVRGQFIEWLGDGKPNR